MFCHRLFFPVSLVIVLGCGVARTPAYGQDLIVDWVGAPSPVHFGMVAEGGESTRTLTGTHNIPVMGAIINVSDSNVVFGGANPDRFSIPTGTAEWNFALTSFGHTHSLPVKYSAVPLLPGATPVTHTATLTIVATGPGGVARTVAPTEIDLIGITRAAEREFYVRDWTHSPTDHDNGDEPSTEAVFYKTSDVWNRWSNGSPPFNSNDQPENEDPRSGSGPLGNNWAFARIHRNEVPPSSSETVTANFLFAQFGTGSNFMPANSGGLVTSAHVGTIDVTFAPLDLLTPKITPAYDWHLDPTSSTHLCLAVEIESPNDPLKTPSLVGYAPGSGTGMADALVLADNNKAQRNLGVVSSAASGVDAFAVYHAIAHNGATYPRDVVLLYEASPEVASRLQDVSVGVIGGCSKQFKSGDTLVLRNMQPGENRWVSLTFRPSEGKEGELLPIDFYEMVGETPVNGFSIAARPSSMTRVIRDALELHRSVFTRMIAGFGIGEAKASDAAAQLILQAKRASEEDYLKFLEIHVHYMEDSFRAVVKQAGVEDSFDVASSLKKLTEAIRLGKPDIASVTHIAFLNKLDSCLTMLQLSEGDTADILQMVRWQADLYGRLGCSGIVARESREFISAYGKKKVDNGDYPDLIERLMNCFRRTAESSLGVNLRLEADIAQMARNLHDLAALQKAHRGYLLKLQKSVDSDLFQSE